MEAKWCFDELCILDVEYVCPCTSPQTYSCELHLGKHLKLPNRTHNFDTLFSEPCEGTKEAILESLAKENSKNSKLKGKILASFSQRFFESKNDLEELMKSLDSTSDVISNCFSKISEARKISKSEQDPILGLLSLQPSEAVEKIKQLIPTNPDWHNSAKTFCKLNKKVEKIIECFIKDKFEAYIDKRLAKIENTLDSNNKYPSPADLNLANITPEIINENKKCKQEIEDWKKEINQNIKYETSLLDLKLNEVTEDINLKLKQLEKSQSALDIFMIKKNIKENKSEILNRQNCQELEMKFRKICLEYENNSNNADILVKQVYQDYVNIYQKNTSIYNFINKDNRTNLYIYNTEIESQDLKILPSQVSLNNSTCIAQLPNNKIFCFGAGHSPMEVVMKYNNGTLIEDNTPPGIACIIDESGEVQNLPSSGTLCYHSSCIYFNNYIYCFGGETCFVYLTRELCYYKPVIVDNSWEKNMRRLTLSKKYDLLKKSWSNLTPMPNADCYCNCAIFKGNILIAGYLNKNILSYSQISNSFMKIPYEFAADKRKILISAERLFLIECSGLTYESEVENEAAWRQIGDSEIRYKPDQVYYSYNKGGIYIGCNSNNTIKYYKFNLDGKNIIELP